MSLQTHLYSQEMGPTQGAPIVKGALLPACVLAAGFMSLIFSSLGELLVVPPDSSVTRAWCGHKEVGLGLQHSGLAFVAQKQGNLCVGFEADSLPQCKLRTAAFEFLHPPGCKLHFPRSQRKGSHFEPGGLLPRP